MTIRKLVPVIFALLLLSSCFPGMDQEQQKPRLSLFVGIDISGSFLKGKYYEDSINFLAHYLYGHLNGLDGLEVPKTLFIGSLGGSKTSEPKTLFPIQTFEGKSVAEIRAKLFELFPKSVENPYTDFNAFFEQVAETVKNKKMILRPISIVLLSDGIPDFPNRRDQSANAKHNIRDVVVLPLEQLSRNISIRLLYTDAVIGSQWQNKIRRQRVKIWTQDALVMTQWKDPKIFIPNLPIEKETKFFDWTKDNVDFGTRVKRVD